MQLMGHEMNEIRLDHHQMYKINDLGGWPYDPSPNTWHSTSQT